MKTGAFDKKWRSIGLPARYEEWMAPGVCLGIGEDGR